MNITHIKNIFTDEELDFIKNQINYSNIPLDNNGNFINHKDNIIQNGVGIHDELGRLQFGGLQLSDSIINKVKNIAKNVSNKNLSLSHAIVVEYSGKYGTPNLPVHYDHDTHDLIINFQLSSNTFWGIGVDLQVYGLEDNSAIVFNGNEYTHWRPHKTFKKEESVTMIFFRFMDEKNPSDYSHLDYIIGHEVFEKINSFRDSLRST